MHEPVNKSTLAWGYNPRWPKIKSFFFFFFKPPSTYLFPATAPSFLPRGSSSSTPAHSPLAKSAGPIYLNVPGFEPLTRTLSPSLKLCFSPDATGVDVARVAWGSDFTFAGGAPLFKLVFELDKDLLIGRGILGVVGRGMPGVVGRCSRLGVVGRFAGVFCAFSFPLTGTETSDEASSPFGAFAGTGAPGVRVNFDILQNMPRFGSHWKYLIPFMAPSFFPINSSRTTPAHSPAANWVSPRKAIYPGLEPFT